MPRKVSSNPATIADNHGGKAYTRTARKKTDPLLAALIAKLPAAGTEWSADQQKAWLNNMAMAFSLVYGGNSAGHDPFPTLATAVAPAPPPKPKKPKHAFIVDVDGYVRRGNGDRILPGDVTSEIYDQRGEDGDLRSMIWADESRGLNGQALTIVGA